MRLYQKKQVDHEIYGYSTSEVLLKQYKRKIKPILDYKENNTIEQFAEKYPGYTKESIEILEYTLKSVNFHLSTLRKVEK